MFPYYEPKNTLLFFKIIEIKEKNWVRSDVNIIIRFFIFWYFEKE